MQCSRSFFVTRFATSTLTLLLITVVVGCGGAEQAKVVQVTGKVMLDGQPMKFGTVTFQPSKGQPASGEIKSNGEFALSTYRPGDGAAVGRHKVKITSYSSQDPAAEKSAGSSESLGESLIPDRYTRFDTSGLEVAVLAGGNKPFEFALDSTIDAPADEEVAQETDEANDAEGATDTAPDADVPGEPKQETADPVPDTPAPAASPPSDAPG